MCGLEYCGGGMGTKLQEFRKVSQPNGEARTLGALDSNRGSPASRI